MFNLSKLRSEYSLGGVLTTLRFSLLGQPSFGDFISVSGTELRTGADRIWINGANKPWHVWNDFGCAFELAW